MTAMTAAFQSWLGKSHLSESLALDAMRLRSVARALGEIRLVVPFLGLRQELRGANKRLSRRLLDSEPRGRSAMVDAFRAAERELPVEVRTPQGTTVAPLLDQVRQNGCADLGPIFTDDQLADIHAHLGTMPVLLAHDAHITTEAAPSLDQVPAGHNYACYKYLDLWSCPHILEAAIRDEIIDLAQGYLGCTPTLYSVNAFWSLPNRTPHKATQLFHRDLEDARSIVVFTLLTPVAEPHEGAHYYVERSHDLNSLEQLMRAKGAGRDDIESLFTRDGTIVESNARRWFDGTARRFDGPAGHSFCIDGYGLHRALVPLSRPRLLLWFRFGNFFNEDAYKMRLPPTHRDSAERLMSRIPSTPRHRYVFRYLEEALATA